MEPTEAEFLSVVRLRITQARLKLGLTQEEAAGRCDLSVRGYQALEAVNAKRRFNPGLVTLRRVALGLEIPLPTLVGDVAREELSTVSPKSEGGNRVNLRKSQQSK